MPRAEAVVDLSAIRGNVATLRARTSAEVMAVVKADGYGHGIVPTARAALAGGASWLGVAVFDEALALRAAGIDAPILSWLWSPDEGDALARVVAAGVDVGVSGSWALDMAMAAAASSGIGRAHPSEDRHRAVAQRRVRHRLARPRDRRGQGPGHRRGRGRSGSGATSSGPTSPATRPPAARSPTSATPSRSPHGRGLDPQVRHLANSAATVSLPEAHFDLVRPGVAIYGLSPIPSRGDFGLVPAMTLRASLASVKRVRAGEGVSYGHAYTTARPTTLALVPVGYARRDSARGRQPGAGVDRRAALHDQRSGVDGPDRRGRRRPGCLGR